MIDAIEANMKLDVSNKHWSYLMHAVIFVVAGRIFPSQGDLHIAPFSDEGLYMEQFSKAHFW